MERNNVITMHGNALTLVGEDIIVGDKAPDFTALDAELKPVKLSDFSGKTIIISAVPSLDTPVCELQTIRFNKEAEKLDAQLLTISMDLPFAQKRFCDAHIIENGKTLSDFKDKEFANKFGLYIKEIGLIARAIFIIDKDGKITYKQIVNEVSNEPDYDNVLEALNKIGV